MQSKEENGRRLYGRINHCEVDIARASEHGHVWITKVDEFFSRQKIHFLEFSTQPDSRVNATRGYL